MKKLIPGGFYLSLDGPDGSGKTTQLKLITNRLSEDYDTVSIREPGTTKAGGLIREILLHSNCNLNPQTELLLFSAARSDNFEKNIVPSLTSNKLIISDRCFDSTLAYQGFGGGGDKEHIKYLNHLASEGINPNLSIILDINSELAQSKLGTNPDNIESRGIKYHQRVRQGYLTIAKENFNRCIVIPYIDGGIDQIHEKIYELTMQRIKQK